MSDKPENRSTVCHGHTAAYESAEAQAHRAELRGGKPAHSDTPPPDTCKFPVTTCSLPGPIQVRPAGFATDGSGKFVHATHGKGFNNGGLPGTAPGARTHVRTATPLDPSKVHMQDAPKGGRSRGK
jgi:hypothetical protein